MKIAELLQTCDVSKLDIELLLSHVIHQPRSWVLAHPEYDLSDEEKQQFTTLLTRKRNKEPLAYIIETKEFYGREFIVTPDVLIPRPATETLITTTLDLLDGKQVDPEIEADTDVIITSTTKEEHPSIHPAHCHTECLAKHDVSKYDNGLGTQNDIVIIDIGTGSGCIAITLALEIPQARFIATDISDAALEVAKHNAMKHGVENRIMFQLEDGIGFLSDINQPFLLVSNPPYIPPGTLLMKDVEKYEPHVALFVQNKDLVQSLISASQIYPQCIGSIVEHSKHH